MLGTMLQEVETRFDVLHLERLALGIPYPAQVEMIGEFGSLAMLLAVLTFRGVCCMGLRAACMT